jgi:hypothetical protein
MVENYNRSALSSLLMMHADEQLPALSPVAIDRIAYRSRSRPGAAMLLCRDDAAGFP